MHSNSMGISAIPDPQTYAQLSRMLGMAWAGSDLLGINLGLLCGWRQHPGAEVPSCRYPLLTPQLFAEICLFPINARLVYTFVQVPCSFAAIH